MGRWQAADPVCGELGPSASSFGAGVSRIVLVLVPNWPR